MKIMLNKNDKVNVIAGVAIFISTLVSFVNEEMQQSITGDLATASLFVLTLAFLPIACNAMSCMFEEDKKMQLGGIIKNLVEILISYLILLLYAGALSQIQIQSLFFHMQLSLMIVLGCLTVTEFLVSLVIDAFNVFR